MPRLTPHVTTYGQRWISEGNTGTLLGRGIPERQRDQYGWDGGQVGNGQAMIRGQRPRYGDLVLVVDDEPSAGRSTEGPEQDAVETTHVTQQSQQAEHGDHGHDSADLDEAGRQ
jgi:hypothetical protein